MKMKLCEATVQCIFLSFISFVTTDLDEWHILNRGSNVRTIAVNKNHLFSVTTSNSLQILISDTGFETIDSNIYDVDVNNDHGIWCTRPNSQILYRSGVTASNPKGTSWTIAIGGLIVITTGRYGLVFGRNIHGLVYIRGSVTPSAHQGSSWLQTYGGAVNFLSCGKRVCLCATNSFTLWTSALLPNIDSPTMPQSWIYLEPGVKTISAYGDNILWKIDTNGITWKAVNLLDSNFIKLSWERRGYQSTKFNDIAVTDKVQYGVESDSQIYVHTGCPIFDFEDDDLSKWDQTGTAFAQQPVVSQQTFYQNHPSGKVGDRLIDTYSGRKNYSMSESAPEATIGDTPTGTLTSPMFQIRTDMLHFVIGGGSPSQNYVGLYIDGTEKFQSAGRSKDHVGPNGAVRSARYWWDVTSHKGKCAYIKIFDQGTTSWGHTIFDDLRASPPCFKGLKVTLTSNDHQRNVSVGQILTDSLSLKGFYTSKTRPLIITISYPVVKGEPLVYIENVNISSTQCTGSVDMTQNKSSSSSSSSSLSSSSSSSLSAAASSSSERWHTVKTYLTNYILSDAQIEIKSRVYDHDDLQTASFLKTKMIIIVNYADEYVRTMKNEWKIMRHGNETAGLEVFEGIPGIRNYSVGENITYEVKLSHNYTASLQRAYNVLIKLFLPPYMSLVSVNGLQNTLGDVVYSPSTSQHVIRIPELLLDDSRHFMIDIRIDSNSKWNRKSLRATPGLFLVDEISFCPRKSCRNMYSNGIEMVHLIKQKVYRITFLSKRSEVTVPKEIYTRIIENSMSLAIICGPYDVMKKIHRSNCFHANLTSNTWHSLNPIMINVSFVDNVNKEIYGTSVVGPKVRLYGEMFRHFQLLSNSEWNTVAAKIGTFAKPIITYGTDATRPSVLSLSTNGPHYKWLCCK